ncbi:uncharacterized protein LOC126749318 [Anthonomus grandis grandis]|uniref:uncharacterized protein LOC126749317 n=1 Tax=Anthonomus grandis grandis TaxID=2921223 RepID=UPI0021657F37|nr:uncharacterized protein LOC126749317 [Anthonomus grandis grandis]XP_050314954.1 uncharacterized protein LOC126749318 [Anthonomus grandis grandis]
MCAKWTEDTTVKFVELYREEECLWNTQLVIYRNKQARESAIKRIVETMEIENFGPIDVKNKIKTLRSTYVQEVAKIKKSQSSGAGADEIYKPKMKWFSVMHMFLQTMDKRRVTCSNLASETYNGSNTLQVEDEVEEATHEEVPLAAEVIKANVSGAINEPTPKRHKAAKSKIKEVAGCIKDLNSLTTSIRDLQSTESSENEFDIFGKSVAAQLNKLPLLAAVTAQAEIQQILTRSRVSNIEGTSTSLGSSRCTSAFSTLPIPESGETLISPESPNTSLPPADNNTSNILSEAYRSAFDLDTDNWG